jgi:hypothetical protein
MTRKLPRPTNKGAVNKCVMISGADQEGNFYIRRSRRRSSPIWCVFTKTGYGRCWTGPSSWSSTGAAATRRPWFRYCPPTCSRAILMRGSRNLSWHFRLATMSSRDDRLRAAALERDHWKRQKLLDEAATSLLKAADRRQRNPVPKKRHELDPPAVNGKWIPLAELPSLLNRRKRHDD